MKWAVYVIRHKDSKVGKDLYVGHLAYRMGRGKIRKYFEEKLSVKKRMSEKCGSRDRSGTELYKRMPEVGLEKWRIVPLVAGVRSRDEALETVKTTRNFLNADLNEWFRPR